MGVSFPSSPANGQVFVPVSSGPIFVFSNGAWQRNAGTALPTNKIVNGAMQISQQNGNTEILGIGVYPADQFFNAGTVGSPGVQRIGTSPSGSLSIRLRNTVTVSTLAVVTI